MSGPPPPEKFHPYSFERQGSRGANGSFSYADTSVYGPGTGPTYPLHFLRTYASDEPRILETRLYQALHVLVPGVGGGARINKKSGFGSYAPGYNPNGAVFIRVFKVS